MNNISCDGLSHRRWAEFRLEVVGQLLAAPPPWGELKSAITVLACKSWQHPISQQPTKFSFATIERWYYLARPEQSPVDALMKQKRCDRGKRCIGDNTIAEHLKTLYKQHPTWTIQLHHENLKELLRKENIQYPSYSTVRRWMLENGFKPQKKYKNKRMKSARAAFLSKETRSFEALFPGSLWHLDFHHGRRKVLTKDGRWIIPILLAILDDHSRLICHLQWYESESTDSLVHGFRQALQKRGLPRELLSDNGSAMTSAEFTEGLKRLSIIHTTTLPYCPEQNGKQERFWGNIEGRLMAMLENKKEITLGELNDFTSVWVEKDYNQRIHRETSSSPINRFLQDDRVIRSCPDHEKLSLSFTRQISRKPRKFDGTVSLQGKRYEIPWAYKHLEKVYLRFQEWDLSQVWLMDQDGEKIISRVFPQDLHKNFSGNRASVDTPASSETITSEEIAPSLKKMMEDYAATGLPHTYMEKK